MIRKYNNNNNNGKGKKNNKSNVEIVVKQSVKMIKRY